MVFCRSCGNQIDVSARFCPTCGTSQAPVVAQRQTGSLILFGFIWTCVFWMALLMFAGFIAGMSNPGNAEQAGERVGAAMGGPFFLLALVIAVILTAAGKLPGTKKP